MDLALTDLLVMVLSVTVTSNVLTNRVSMVSSVFLYKQLLLLPTQFLLFTYTLTE